MEGKFDLERRRAKRKRFNWTKRLVTPTTVRVLVSVTVGITNVVAALYRLFNVFRE